MMRIHFNNKTKMIHTSSTQKNSNRSAFQTLDMFKLYWASKGGLDAELEMALVIMDAMQHDTIFMNDENLRFLFTMNIESLSLNKAAM